MKNTKSRLPVKYTDFWMMATSTPLRIPPSTGDHSAGLFFTLPSLACGEGKCVLLKSLVLVLNMATASQSTHQGVPSPLEQPAQVPARDGRSRRQPLCFNTVVSSGAAQACAAACFRSSLTHEPNTQNKPQRLPHLTCSEYICEPHMSWNIIKDSIRSRTTHRCFPLP